MQSLKGDPKAQRNLLLQISNKVSFYLTQIAPKIIALEKITKGMEDA